MSRLKQKLPIPTFQNNSIKTDFVFAVVVVAVVVVAVVTSIEQHLLPKNSSDFSTSFIKFAGWRPTTCLKSTRLQILFNYFAYMIKNAFHVSKIK